MPLLLTTTGTFVRGESDLPLQNSRGDDIPQNCAQIAPKNIENHQNPSNNIERDRRRKIFKKSLFTGEIPYFLRLRFERGFLHTVEVTGSNPVSPTTPSVCMTQS